MVDALVSVVLERLSSIIIQQLEQEVRLVVGVENEVEKLISNFQAIQAVLADAEERQLKDASIKRWLDQLQGISYDMDDVLDEWGTAIEKSRMKVNEHPRKTARKVCSFMIFSCFRFREVGLRRDIAYKIKELNDKIDGIVIEKNRFHFKSFEVGVKQLEHQKTTSVIDVAEVKGREKDKNRVMSMLLSESSQVPTLPTISLVGMGGIGKTTLAKLVFNDPEVESHFEKRIWVCVSDPFDEIRIAKAILEDLLGSAQNLNELQTLVKHVQQYIRGTKFLLVLDDVWNEDSTKWEQLKNSLKCGLPGSRILVTTRNEIVANSMGSSSPDILELGLLSTEECWSLFSQVAFFGKTSKERENLEDIGRKIAAKCKGLPLAAKSLGSLLRFKRRTEEWQSILNSDVWDIKEAESSILAPLWLSYNDLPSEMKRCFSYCAVFPKDFTFYRGALIKLWMAQGFLQETLNKEMEVMGNECFDALAARSLFQDFKKEKGSSSVIACKMHDMVHDFAQHLTKNECFSVEMDGLAESKIESLSRDVRHLMVVFRNHTTPFPATIHHFRKLRTLIVDGGPSTSDPLPNLLTNLSCLRTLNLSISHIEEVPSNIGKLIHLRHVKFSSNKIKELPEEICELHNMQTLDVSFCRLKQLPNNVGKLVKLRHLCVFSGLDSFLMMRGLEGLNSLRELDEFHVSDSGESEVSNLGDLKNLNHLQGSLKIKWLGDVKVPDDVKKAEFKSKKNLTGLDLWFKGRTDRRIIHDDEVLEALEPPPNLEFLAICHYQGIKVFPSWISSLTKLRVVRLRNFGKIENLPPLGKLPSLEVLFVIGLDCVKKVGHEFLGLHVDDDDTDISNAETTREKDGIGEITSSLSNTIIAFPKLKTLFLLNLRKWEEWDDGSWKRGNEDKTNMLIIMPCLRSLRILDCPNLKALPNYLFQSTTLEELVIKRSPILAQQFRKGIGKGWPNTSHTPNIKIL